MTCPQLPLCPARKEAPADTLWPVHQQQQPSQGSAPLALDFSSQDRNPEGLPRVCWGAPLPAVRVLLRAILLCCFLRLWLIFSLFWARRRSQAAGGWLCPWSSRSTDAGRLTSALSSTPESALIPPARRPQPPRKAAEALDLTARASRQASSRSGDPS